MHTLKTSSERVIARGSRTELRLVNAPLVEGRLVERPLVEVSSGTSSQWVEKRLLPFANVEPERRRLAQEARFHLLCAVPGVVPLFDRQEARRVASLSACASFRRTHILGYSLRDFLHGISVRTVPVCRPFSVRVVAALCQILARIHRIKDHRGRCLKIVHRDVTPGNVLVDTNGNVWLLDFGLSHVPRTSLRDDETLQGTRLLLPPELERGGQPSTRSDVFQAALLLFLLDEVPSSLATFDGSRALLARARESLEERFHSLVISAALSDQPHERPSASGLERALDAQLKQDGSGAR